MKPPLLVLCATDLSEDADLATVAASDFARLFGSRLVLVHAVPYPAPAQVLFPHLIQGTMDRLMAVSRVAAETVSTRVASLTGRAAEDIDVRVDVGAPDEVIVETAEEVGADLLVIGLAGSDSEGRGPGATAVRIARHAHCPVLVVRKGPVKGPVLAATDLSDPAQGALQMGALVAAQTLAPMVAVHVVDYSPVVVVPEAFGPGIPIPVSEEEHQAILKAAGEKLVEALSHVEVKADRLVEEGTPSDRIVAVAEQIEASLVVVGTAGGGGLRRMLLGSVAEEVLRLAPCSVLLVRHHTSGGHE
ncbi:MAG: universal stress protein [Vicinamibacteria bacterium]|jgi:universal stress protein E|nr:universal stress protein [Vicinamibacteria bacterium]MBP9947236.1 universal stress protein [Vicinamibacteria bacterium]